MDRRAFLIGGGLVAGDGLVRPLNAPAAATAGLGVQPGATPPVITANRVVVYGTGAGVFVYSPSPGAGNLIVSMASPAGTDAYGNSYPNGLGVSAGAILGSVIEAGTVGTTQIANGAVTGTQLASSVTARSIGGITTTISGTAPASPVTGDLWINSAAGYQLNQWTGTAWSALSWTATDVLSAATITGSLIAASTITGGNIAAGTVTASNIQALDSLLVGPTQGIGPNPFFPGGDVSQWAAYTGLPQSVSGAGLPAGAPYAYAAYTGNFPYGIKTAAAIPVTAGNAYQITGWIYSTASSGNVNFAWTGASTTFNTVTLTPNTWTPVSVTATAPAGATALTPEFAVSSAAFYLEAPVVLPQVPGGLIQAGTVTASQIAANTITAAQLAAGIVYAGIVNSTTINAATFTGSVFEGTDFILNSSGAFFYSGTPAAGNLIASIASVAGTDGFGNAYQAGLVSYSPPGGATALFQSGGVLFNAGAFNGVTAGEIVAPVDGQLNILGGITTTAGDAEATLSLVSKVGSGLGYPVILTGPVIVPPDPAGPTFETWHSVALSGITIPNGGGTPTGRLRYRLLPTNQVLVDCSLSFTATTAPGSVNLVTLGTGYVPANTVNWPVRVYTATAPANLELVGGVTTGGVLQINNIPTGATNLAYCQAFPLD